MKNRIIAITGGIGSGKSKVCEIIKNLGYNVLSADEIYKNLIKDDKIVEKIYNSLNIPYTLGEVFDNKKVSKIVFESKDKLKILNDITHPLIMQEIFRKSKELGGVVFNEIPLLFESGLEKYYSDIIVVVRPLEKRIESVKLRSNLSKEEIVKIINNQFDYENLQKNKHTIINNDKDLLSLNKEVIGAISEFIK